MPSIDTISHYYYPSSKNFVKFGDISNLNWRIGAWWESDREVRETFFEIFPNLPAINIFNSFNFFQKTR